ncbi:MAG: tRNA preQ1(34) S-adenosylmethionine ribosyltransferase-isomerase QueA [Candidatus Omnitrophica bacterium]|nr:tRNA preQ1(34) S-adenosylmethionine ribosyltransferase-isomerase QueA [Candidatus Omnitrophota bacterium]
MKLSDFHYTLPKELIALAPMRERTGSRLLVLSRSDQKIEHRKFRDLLDYFRPGDALFLNDTRVIPARLEAKRPTGGKAEILLLQELMPGTWEALIKPGSRVKRDTVLEIAPDFHATVLDDGPVRKVEFEPKEKFWPMIERYGQMPLPPYIKRKVTPEDRETYQTVFAKHAGAVAAPTAGLHFDKDFLNAIEKKGVRIGWITLHVGYGTFKPLAEEEEDVTKHSMHEEFFRVSEEAVKLHEETRQKGGRVFVCGTTALRALESAKQPDGKLKPREGRTSIFIYPPYRIQTADALITNFHLPRTSLLLLVSAFAGRETILRAYESAIQERYRFFSYGDAMLIL